MNNQFNRDHGPVRVNVPNPDKDSTQGRVCAVTTDGVTARTATGQEVLIANNSGSIKSRVIVYPDKK